VGSTTHEDVTVAVASEAERVDRGRPRQITPIPDRGDYTCHHPLPPCTSAPTLQVEDLAAGGRAGRYDAAVTSLR
jgi:hypothetical protein